MDHNEMALQPASHEIWESKYRLVAKEGTIIDEDVEGTYRRVARTLAGVEAVESDRSVWEERFFEAMKAGAIPAGRIIANAGAQDYKPLTSTVNCTVSATIRDSMDAILTGIREAGLTLKAGCGIGYEFSTLRHNGAWVGGAGSQTRGPLGFMDVYDQMCFTISSAGGRRGAQMATFDVGHPDILDFIRAKREDGRLRQFNLSVLVTEEFINAVEADEEWALAFPIKARRALPEDPASIVWRRGAIEQGYHCNERGQIACEVVRRVPARQIWDEIMRSTYDYAEPGFILIDEVNRMNNNWWCEQIRATNPCVHGDTWVLTADGPCRAHELVGRQQTLQVDGRRWSTTEEGFFATGRRTVYAVKTQEGYEVMLTGEHEVLSRRGETSKWDWNRVWDLGPGDEIKLSDHFVNTSGAGTGPETSSVPETGVAIGKKLARDDSEKKHDDELVEGLNRAGQRETRDILRGLVDAKGIFRDAMLWIPMASPVLRDAVQRGLARCGILTWNEDGVLKTTRVHLARYLRRMGSDNAGLLKSLEDCVRQHSWTTKTNENQTVEYGGIVARVISVKGEPEPCTVYDVTVPEVRSFDANAIVVSNCGEQPLPPYGACLLGSVNLTKLVREPFTGNAALDYDGLERLVGVFTRMLDNVVEISGLPLDEQRKEITYKRRHGMGFLGLGSALAMLGIRYGSPESIEVTDKVSRILAKVGWETGVELAKEKGMAPILRDDHTVTREMIERRPRMAEDGISEGDRVPGRVLLGRYSNYMKVLEEAIPGIGEQVAEHGARFTHHSAIAPTGTIALSLANNASNGIEPSYAHRYGRNVIEEGRKTKRKVNVWSYELMAYRHLIDKKADETTVPGTFSTSAEVSPEEHIDIQAAAQKWMDASISKTCNVPTDFPFERFEGIYRRAIKHGLKGCTTFRFNPEAFQGVLVKEEDLGRTTYRFVTEDGDAFEVKGNEEVEYEGEIHTAANLYDALKEGYYGKF